MSASTSRKPAAKPLHRPRLSRKSSAIVTKVLGAVEESDVRMNVATPDKRAGLEKAARARIVQGSLTTTQAKESAEGLHAWRKVVAHCQPFPPAPDSTRDWPEDAAHENGRYLCRCWNCRETFTGHKRRVECHVCSDANGSEALRREELLKAGGLSPSEWALVTPHERTANNARYANLLLELTVERNLRRSMAAAFLRVKAAVPGGAVPGAHYAIKDAAEIAQECEELDAEIAARDASRSGKASA